MFSEVCLIVTLCDTQDLWLLPRVDNTFKSRGCRTWLLVRCLSNIKLM